MEVELK